MINGLDFMDDPITGDLMIVGGDLSIDVGNDHHVKNILLAPKGGYKCTPIVGVGITSFINSPNSAYVIDELKSKIKLQLQYDKFVNPVVLMDNITAIKISVTR